MTEIASSSSRARAVIVVAPAWPRGGSANLFAAQVMAHARRGRQVCLHLGPTERWQSASQRDYWSDTCAAMSFPGCACVTYGRIHGQSKTSLGGFLRNAIWKHDDALWRFAHTAATATLPQDLLDFIAAHEIETIHVNHAFEMGLGTTLADFIAHRQGARPLIICESHDIQAKAIKLNYSEASGDRLERLLATEEALYGGADLLTHCSYDDYVYFSRRLPQLRHALLSPTLRADTEHQLREARGQAVTPAYDFLFLGDNHAANFASVAWILNEVLPHLGDTPYRLAIVGNVVDRFKRHSPRLLERYENMFLGRVDDIISYYKSTRSLLVPSVEGTGISIKLIEALCSGKPVIATSGALRSMPLPARAASGLHVCDDPRHYAEAMRACLTASAHSAATASIYDQFFSNAAFCERLDHILDGSRSRGGKQGRPRAAGDLAT